MHEVVFLLPTCMSRHDVANSICCFCCIEQLTTYTDPFLMIPKHLQCVHIPIFTCVDNMIKEDAISTQSRKIVSPCKLAITLRSYSCIFWRQEYFNTEHCLNPYICFKFLKCLSTYFEISVLSGAGV